MSDRRQNTKDGCSCKIRKQAVVCVSALKLATRRCRLTPSVIHVQRSSVVTSRIHRLCQFSAHAAVGERTDTIIGLTWSGQPAANSHSMRCAGSSISTITYIYIDCIMQHVCSGLTCRGSDALLMPFLQMACTSQVLPPAQLGTYCSPAE